ncbi:MAG: ABC transporter permease [Muribaculaceae bacterium]|nr:ABC transporter permease [Muribaculaceae bacterium]
MKRDTIIKVLSLSLGLTIGIVLIAKIFFELSINKYIKDYDRIYLIQSNLDKGEEPVLFNNISGGVATGFKNEIPGVETVTKTTSLFNSPNFKDSDGNVWKYAYPQAIVADSCFFDVFPMTVYAGNPHEIFNQRDKVMISKAFAEKLGGVNKALGMVITNEDYADFPLTVEGVFENFPSNSTISPEIIFSMAILPEVSTENWVGNDRYTGYVKLKPGVDTETLKDGIDKMHANHPQLQEYEKMGMRVWFTLGNIHKVYSESNNVKNTVMVLSIIVFLIVSVSILNYILIVVSGMVRRSKDISIRKCYGAGKISIYFMLFRESTWQIVAALIISAIIILCCGSLIKEYTGFYFSDLLVPQSILAIAVVISLIFMISVLAPAKIYFNKSIDKVLRGYNSGAKKWKMTLLSIQIAINIFIVSFVLISGLQYNKIIRYNPGYTTDNILVIDYFSREFNNYSRIVDAVKSISGVENVGFSNSVPVEPQSGNNVTFPEGKEDSYIHVSDLYWASPEVFDMLNIPFIEGERPTKPYEVAVSKSFVEQMQNLGEAGESPLGKLINVTDRSQSTLTISGVYDDILLGNLMYADSRPSIWEFGSLDKDDNYFMYILIKTESITPEILSHIKDTAEEQLNGKSIDITILNNYVKDTYKESLKIRNIFLIGGAFSILIALMGLIGFINDEAQRRRKELAIRKINGASSKDLFSLFYSSIIKLSLASAVVACCGAFIMGRHWLQQFSEKISLTPLIFICATLFILIIVTVVVMINSYKVITSNPTQSLYNE